MKRLGPELKMPKLKGSDLKMPPFLVDLYWDLRDRRLLPLVALVVVAIGAVPFVLSGGSEKEAPPLAGAASAVAEPASESSTLTVVEAKPGLRDYRKRLAHRSPVDPFKQRYTAPVVTSHLQTQSSTVTTASTSSTSSSNEATTVSSETATITPSGSPSNSSPSKPSSNGGGGDETQPHLTYFTFAIDVKVSLVPGGEASSSQASNEEISNGEGGSDKPSESTIRRGVEPATPLPGKKAPVVTYMGAIHNAKTALFLISDDVTSVFGDGNCLSGNDPCQLLGVEAGIPETFTYGYNHNRLKIEVLKIEPVVTGHS
jgi:hypothetical protein